MNYNKKTPLMKRGLKHCTLERIRTSGLRIRSPLLYPAELRGHKLYDKLHYYINAIQDSKT